MSAFPPLLDIERTSLGLPSLYECAA